MKKSGIAKQLLLHAVASSVVVLGLFIFFVIYSIIELSESNIDCPPAFMAQALFSIAVFGFIACIIGAVSAVMSVLLQICQKKLNFPAWLPVALFTMISLILYLNSENNESPLLILSIIALCIMIYWVSMLTTKIMIDKIHIFIEERYLQKNDKNGK